LNDSARINPAYFLLAEVEFQDPVTWGEERNNRNLPLCYPRLSVFIRGQSFFLARPDDLFARRAGFWLRLCRAVWIVDHLEVTHPLGARQGSRLPPNCRTSKP
jgi:hypothetical protein